MPKSNMGTERKAKRKSIKEVLKILKHKGNKSLEIARETILKEKIQSKEAREALQYYVENFLEPTPSALLALSCETVGYGTEETFWMGAALTLLVGAVDIHDDIIDQSARKNGRPTVLGKFGKEIALLTGNAFLFEGFVLFDKATRCFDSKKANYLIETLKTAFFEMGDGHALEAGLRGKLEINPKEYLRIVEMKAASWEAVTKIGAIIGNGKKEEIAALAQYGRIWGVLSTIRNDFIDLFEINELQNRMLNEILPLPILCAFEDSQIKKEIVTILSKQKITRMDLETVLNLVFEARQVKDLKKTLQSLISETRSRLVALKKSRAKAILELFISVMLENLD